MAINDKVIVQNDDGSCTVQSLKAYPIVTSPDNSLTITPATDPATGRIDYQITKTNVIYTVAVTNPASDGDNTIEFTVTGTEQPSGTVVSTQPISFALEEGQYFSAVSPTPDAGGIVTFTVVNDDGEAVGTPQMLDLSAYINPVILDTSPTDTVELEYNAGTDTYTVSGSSISQVVDPVAGITTTTFTKPDGTVITWVSGDDECAEYASAPTDISTFKIHGCDANGKGSLSLDDFSRFETVCHDDGAVTLQTRNIATNSIDSSARLYTTSKTVEASIADSALPTQVAGGVSGIIATVAMDLSPLLNACASEISIKAEHGYELGAGLQTGANNYFQVVMSLDGGATYTDLSTGGLDVISVFNGSALPFGLKELSHTDFWHGVITPSDTVVFGLLINNEITSGIIDPFKVSIYATAHHLKCC